MMTSPLELNFDFKTHIYSMLVKSFGEHAPEQTHKLEEFVARLEEERLKIDAFKRELPLCMQLLNNAMEASRQQLQSQRTNQGTRPVLEEFIPLKHTSSSEPPTENEGNVSADKSNWMISAQLWNQENEENKPPLSPLMTSTHETDIKLALSGKQRINGGAFIPFPSKDRNSSSCTAAFPELALASSHKEEMQEKKISVESNSKRENSVKSGNSSVSEKEQLGGVANTNQTQRKARRCWSPDLHRRFVNALHMLGGSQVATPKQIRELMKVDGLTNDEVKSHLQKYRLHTRRPSPSPQTAVTAAPQLVVLGGIWVPPEYAAAAAHGGAQAAALYGAHAAASHHVPPTFCSAAPSMPQEMYPAIAPAHPPSNHQLHNHHIRHHQLHVYSNPTQTQGNSSPESDNQGGSAGNPSESIEDDKSESGGSWKADSGGENGGDRRRVDGEDSNARVVSLKF